MIRPSAALIAALLLAFVGFALRASAVTVSLIAQSVAPYGAEPLGTPVFGPDGTAYGTTELGGTRNLGTIYAVDTDGSLKWLYNFDGIHGQNPAGALAFGGDGNLYGVTQTGGRHNDGVVFQVTPSGAFSVIHNFAAPEGKWPNSPLAALGPNKLVGSFEYGGSHGCGALFQVTTAGAFTPLHQFSGPDGCYPIGGLTFDPARKFFYGATATGGELSSGQPQGTVYRTPAGNELETIYTFSGPDGASPSGSLYLAPGGILWGVTSQGGSSAGSNGVLFDIDHTGSLSVVHDFDGTDGSAPAAPVTADSTGTINGATMAGSGSLFTLGTGGAFASDNPFTTTAVFQPGSGLATGSDGRPYGVSTNGADGGALYRVNTDGSVNPFFAFVYPAGVQLDATLVQAPSGAILGAGYEGGNFDNGAIFKYDGSPTLLGLHSFLNSTTDGGFPTALCENPLGQMFGIAFTGGANGNGTLFEITAAGDDTTLYNFDGATGAPAALTPARVGAVLYGVCGGYIFSYSANGGFNLLFPVPANCGSGVSSLVQGTDGGLYGTTFYGGANNDGTLFRVTLWGNFTVLHNFTASDGTTEYTQLTAGSDGLVYGTTFPNGSGNGEVYNCSRNAAFTVLHAFDGTDGSEPYGGVVEASPGLFYGTTLSGGMDGLGTIYSIESSSAFASLYSDSGPTGVAPYGKLIKATDGTFYGVTQTGGLYTFAP